jgi:hypothetical protein
VKHTIYSIYWEVAEEYQPPTWAKNDNVARARLQHMLNQNPQLQPEQWSIWKLGEFNDETGVITPINPTRVVPKIKETAE